MRWAPKSVALVYLFFPVTANPQANRGLKDSVRDDDRPDDDVYPKDSTAYKSRHPPKRQTQHDDDENRHVADDDSVTMAAAAMDDDGVLHNLKHHILRPTLDPTLGPTPFPTPRPVWTMIPTADPTVSPTLIPTIVPTPAPTALPTKAPTINNACFGLHKNLPRYVETHCQQFKAKGYHCVDKCKGAIVKHPFMRDAIEKCPPQRGYRMIGREIKGLCWPDDCVPVMDYFCGDMIGKGAHGWDLQWGPARQGYFNLCDACVWYYTTTRKPKVKDNGCWLANQHNGYCLTRDPLGRYQGVPQGVGMNHWHIGSRLTQPIHWKYSSNVTAIKSDWAQFVEFQARFHHRRYRTGGG